VIGIGFLMPFVARESVAEAGEQTDVRRVLLRRARRVSSSS